MPQERAAILVKQHVKNDDVKKLWLHMEFYAMFMKVSDHNFSVISPEFIFRKLNLLLVASFPYMCSRSQTPK